MWRDEGSEEGRYCRALIAADCGLTDWRGGGAPGRLPGSVHPSAMDGRGRREKFLPVVEDSLTGGPSLAVSCREVLPAWALHTPNAAAAALGRGCLPDASLREISC